MCCVCRREHQSEKACPKLHFHRIVQRHTDESLGDCSFLNACFNRATCKYVHYEVDESLDDPEEQVRGRGEGRGREGEGEGRGRGRGRPHSHYSRSGQVRRSPG